MKIVAHSTIQTLTHLSECAGDSATAALLRERIQQSVALIRVLADEAAAAVASSAAAQRDRYPDDDSLAPSDTQDRDEEMEEADEEDLRIAESILLTELDASDVYPSGKRAASLRASLQLLTKRPRRASGSAAVTKLHLKDKPRSDAPAAPPPS